MKDWGKLKADVDMILSKHFTKGRGGKKVDKVIVHYNAGNLTIGGCYSVWQGREASAHYQVEDGGRIGQLVWDADTAWHCGVFTQNQRSIGIEHANRADGTISEKCLDNGAHLVAAICKHYGLGRPEWLKNVFPHKYFKATSCPGQIYGSQKDAYIKRAQEWYDAMTGEGSAPSAGGSGSASGSSKALTVDGYWGSSTTRRLQEVLGAPYKDGEVSRQNPAHKSKMPACTSGWEWGLGDGSGSQTIKLVQARVGAAQDGIMGPGTANALIRHYQSETGAIADGRLDAASPTVKAMQRHLNSGTF